MWDIIVLVISILIFIGLLHDTIPHAEKAIEMCKEGRLFLGVFLYILTLVPYAILGYLTSELMSVM